MKVVLEFDCDEPLARAIAIHNGERSGQMAGPHEISQWAKETLAVSGDILVQETREQMEAEESPS